MRWICVDLILLSALSTTPSFACSPMIKVGTPAAAPKVGSDLDRRLVDAKLPPSELDKIKSFRADIANLLAKRKLEAALAVEEQAMKMLGYHKSWLRCGRPGMYIWFKDAPKLGAGLRANL